MIFTELRFLVFFAVVFVIHWGLRRASHRKLWLLAASYCFYAAWDWRFLSLVLVSTLAGYHAGLAMAHPAADRRRRLAVLRISLLVHLGLLGLFKYFHFFAGEAVRLAGLLGFEAHRPVLDIVLPLGISFYTFQILSYTIDRYFGRIPTERSLLDFALFAGFFPQLVAGPIVRAGFFLPQLKALRPFPAGRVRVLALIFLIGFFKKAVVADNLAPTVDAFYLDPGGFGSVDAALVSFLFTVQIYGDFSGYSDMAIACAGLLGYRLRRNFFYPFFASNIAEFWQRWHISLSNWVRDYVFFPLLRLRPLRGSALLCAMLLMGLWHGAGWNFVAFGGVHGLCMAIYARTHFRYGGLLGRWAAPLGQLFTFTFFSLSLSLFFRCADIGQTVEVVQAWLSPALPATLASPLMLGGVACVAALHALGHRRATARWLMRVPGWLFVAGYGAAAGLMLPFVPEDAQPFIYFQF